MMGINRAFLAALVVTLAGAAGCNDASGPVAGGHGHEPKTGHGREVAKRQDQHDDHEEHAGSSSVLIDQKMAKRIGLTTEAVKLRPLPAELSTTGEVDFDRDALAHVSARLPGRVADVLKTLGDDVGRGDWLVVLDSIELGQAKAMYLQAKAAEEVARLALAREEGLLKDRITSEREVLEARGRHLSAKSALDVAAETLRLYGLSDASIGALKFGEKGASSVPVRAPIAGRIVDKHVTRGELVTPDKALFTIADLSSVWVWIDLFERDLPLVHVGDDVAVSTASVPGRVFVGKIGYIRDEVDRDTRAARARIDVENADRKLKPGMYATVQVADPHAEGGKGEAAQGLAVPVSALVQEGEAAFVFVETSADTFERRRVQLGRRSAQVVEVLDGLKRGDAVATKGTFYLKSESRKGSLGESGHSH